MNNNNNNNNKHEWQFSFVVPYVAKTSDTEKHRRKMGWLNVRWESSERRFEDGF